MASEDGEHQPEMVKATYADGTVSFYDSALHAHGTHYDGSPLVSLVAAPGETQRVELPDKPAVADAVPAETPQELILRLEAELEAAREAHAGAEQG